MADPAITLYDIPSHTANPQAWSPNTWKARFVLNYKCIPYKTAWVSYPDIEPTLTKLGSAPTATKPNDPTKAHYTLPVIVDTSSGSPVVVADSLAIAEYLDATYPDRPVFSKHKAIDYAFEQCFNSLAAPHFRPLVVPRTLAILDDRSKVYFRQSREQWFGKKLEEFSPEGDVRDGHRKALQNGLDQFAAILDKNGPNVDYMAGGSEPTRGDMVLVSYLTWIKVVAPDEWEKGVKHWNGGRWERLLNKTEKWMVVH